jgi:type VI secretion system protein ImpL
MKEKIAIDFFNETNQLFKKLGRQRNNFLRELPWYLVLGAANSGKSSFLANIELNFLSENHSGQSRSSQNFRLAKEAVFYEASLSHLNEKSSAENDDDFVSEFLQFVRKHRFKNRLNGIILIIDLPSIMPSLAAGDVVAQLPLTTILRKTYQLLKTQTPIYVVLTKCDLMAGFCEFFADMSKEQRNQLWGIRFPALPFATKQQLVEYFEHAFAQLIDKLNTQLLARIDRERNLHNRVLIHHFPQQLQILKQVLVEYLFHQDGLQMRGIYFVSNLQQGAVIDFLAQAIAGQLHMPLNTTANLLPQKKAFFVKNFFKDVMAKEADFVLRSAYWQRRNLINYQLTWAGSVASLMLMTICFSYVHRMNEDNLQQFAENLASYRQAAQTFLSADNSLFGLLPILNSLNNIKSGYVKNSAMLGWLALYQPWRAAHKINFVWHKLLANYLLPRVAIQIEQLLKKEDLDPELLYRALKGYLVFTHSPGVDAKWLKSPVSYILEQQLPDKVAEKNQLNDYLEQALQQPIAVRVLDEAILQKLRQRLQNIPAVQFAYYEMKQAAEDSSHYFNVADRLGESFSQIFTYRNSNMATIPVLYTYSGYKALSERRIEKWVRHAAEIYKILGLQPTIDSKVLSMQMTPRLWSLYAADYASHWQRLLANIKVVPLSNLSEATQLTAGLMSADSPLLKLLSLVRENTAVSPEKYLQVAQYFSAINHLTTVSKSVNQYTHLIKILSALHDYLAKLQNMPNVEQAEFQDAAAIMQNKLPNHPLVLLRVAAEALPSPIATWMLEVADNSMHILLQGAHQVINKAWQSQVFPYYVANLQQKFPLAGSAVNSINMADFATFFNGRGIFLQFFSNYLAPFIDTSRTTWQQRSWGENALDISVTALLQLQRAWLIQQLYFKNGETTPVRYFSIKPIYLDAESSGVTVQLANQSMHYRHGPQQSVNWSWSLQGHAEQSSVSFSDFKGHSYSRSFDGPWSWYELLSATRLENSNGLGRYIWTITQAKHKAIFELTTADNLPAAELHMLRELELPQRL